MNYSRERSFLSGKVLLCTLALSACSTAPLRPEPNYLPDLQQSQVVESARRHNIDLSAPLTAKDLASIAVLSNPELKVLRASENLANAQVFAAGLFPDPSFSLGVDNPINGSGLVNAISASIGLDVGALLTRSSTLSASEAHLQSVRFDIAWAEWLTAENAKLLASQISYLREIHHLSETALALSHDELMRTETAVLRGDLPRSAIQLPLLVNTDARSQSRNTESLLLVATQELHRLMGLPPSVGLTLASPTPTTEQLELPVTDALFKLATIHRADLAGMRMERKSAAENTNTARMKQYPLPVIALNAARDTGNLKTLGPSVSITLPLWNRGRGDLAIAQATEEQADAAYSARLLNIYADLDAAYSALLLVNKQARDATEIALQMDALVSGTLAAVARGDYAASLSNELRIASINKHIQAIELAMKQAELLIALELNLGVPLENIK